MAVLTNHQKKALDYSKHISLTANAGSGKTTVFAKRYVEIILKENISLSNIVAITFTDKAASELYTKIAKELEERILNSEGSKKEKVERIRQNLISARISTIHSFCIDILKDYAPEAGIDANFAPIDTRLADELIEKSIEEILGTKLADDNKFTKFCIRLFGNKSLFSTNLKLLFKKRKTVQLLLENFYSLSVDELIEKYNGLLEEKLTKLLSKQIDDFILNVSELNNYVLNLNKNDRANTIKSIIQNYDEDNSIFNKLGIFNELRSQISTKSFTVRKRGYLPNNIDISYQKNIDSINYCLQELKEFSEFSINDLATRDLVTFGLGLAELFSEINSLYTIKKQQRAFLDFEDLLLKTYQLLKNENVKKELTEKFKYIMIDEFQDTDELQYNIFMPILNNLLTGNLFVVGDEKQSIYMFREAEVELFNQTKSEIEKVVNNESLLELPHSFRLAPNIALFTNVLFKNVFENPNENFNEVEHRNLVCAYQDSIEGNVEFLINDTDDNEAELVVKKINILIYEGKYNYNDIAILCTRKKNFKELEKYLSKYSIPFNIVGGKGFFQQQLVYDIYNYLSFLVNNSDDFALATILRGPFYNLSDIRLTKIARSEGDTYFDKIKNFPEFKNITDQLNKHIILSKSLTTNELIRKICNDTAFWAYLSNKNNGEQELANLEKLIQFAIQIDEAGFTNLYDFVSYLRDSINQLEDEGHADITDGSNAVKIMTVHQAKGLEFKVVILYKTNQNPKNTNIKSKSIEIDKDFGILTKLPSNGNFFENYTSAPIVNLQNYLKNKKELAELKRLLYVAITRAQEMLVISLSNSNSIRKNSFAHLIDSALSIDYSKSEFEIADELEFMTLYKDSYRNEKRIISETISLIKEIELNSLFDESESYKPSERTDFKIEPIEASEKNEIISASKISLFLNCPKKYQLTYEFGYGELTRLFVQELDIELNLKEDELGIPANVTGSLTHSVLEREVSGEKLEETVKELINIDESTFHYDTEQKSKITKEVIELVKNFHNSDYFKKVKLYPNYFNEKEFYKKENDYFLYGIIDKLIVDDSKIIIIDYKTDKVNKNNVEQKKEIYFNQLLFYAYILISEFPKINSFELHLVFLRNIKLSSIKKISKNEIYLFGDKIHDSVLKIRAKDFSENTSGCRDMQYYLLN